MFGKYRKRVLIVSFFLILAGGLFLVSAPKTVNANPLDEFLKQNNAAPEIAEAYRFAKENPQGVLSIVKCYCGCLTNGSKHKNNWHCFFNDDGSIDLMGLNCGLCVKTALISKQMLAEGKSVQEISDYVDTRWGRGD